MGASSHAGSEGAGQELFALTDEQILEIEPEAQTEVAGGDNQQFADAAAREDAPVQESSGARTSQRDRETADKTSSAGRAATSGVGAAEPPRWLADVMNDPQRGDEARELWQGVERERQEAAAYREVFAQPAEARAAAERARALDEIDRAYFAGDAGERSKLAATMLREDPAAFREMVFEGLRALELADRNAGSGRTSSDSRLARVFGGADGAAGQGTAASPAITSATSGTSAGQASTGAAGQHGNAEDGARITAYASFEKSANEELERSVGGAIERTLEQAMPNTGRTDNGSLRSRLVGAVRQDVEKALQGDRQLGERVTQLLSGKRLNSETRAQVVRLIGERAEQLVPGAAKRILSDWTQTTLAAHREKTGRGAAAASRQEVSAASSGRSPKGEGQGKPERQSTSERARGSTTPARSVDYRKLSDEQILAM